ncbi:MULTISPECIES: hypothetical protein [Rhizobium]|uniref:hypothetical protein n=1 Tax=Rhizobium terrae TaxID=2171756 RepID=UPI000E3E5F9C|nr:hypothetical protein [Rhizobium terrae]
MLENRLPSAKAVDKAELQMLQQVFDQICQSRDIGKNTVRAEWLAAELISLFQHGVRHPRQLLALLSGEDFS